jgi:hypothetical protein
VKNRYLIDPDARRDLEPGAMPTLAVGMLGQVQNHGATLGMEHRTARRPTHDVLASLRSIAHADGKRRTWHRTTLLAWMQQRTV